MSTAAVVPVYNRRDNLELLLLSLEQQTTNDFTVVVADDGSTDGTRAMVQARSSNPWWGDRLRWIGCGPSRGVRTGRARNIGAGNVPDATSLLVMLDSDLVLRPEAIADFAHTHASHPDLVFLGQVEWLPPLDREVVQRAISEHDLPSLRSQVPTGVPHRVEGTFVGTELRGGLFDGASPLPGPLRPEWALPLNSAWPLDVYWSVGGFDEAMIGYGYQDMDLGARAMKVGVRCLPRPEMWALHVWHPKPAKAMGENQRNLDFYLRRHGHNEIIATDVNWRLWFHYHAQRGGSVARSDGRLWALSARGDHRLALPDEGWLVRLGHSPHDVADTATHALADSADEGFATE